MITVAHSHRSPTKILDSWGSTPHNEIVAKIAPRKWGLARVNRELLEEMLRDGDITAAGFEKLTSPVKKRPVLSQVLYLVGGLLLLLGLGAIIADSLRRLASPVLFLLLGILLSTVFAYIARLLERKRLTVPSLVGWMASYCSNLLITLSLPFLIGGPLLSSSSFSWGLPFSLEGVLLAWGLFFALGLLYIRVPVLVFADAIVLFQVTTVVTHLIWFGPSSDHSLAPGAREIILIASGALYIALGLYRDGQWKRDYGFWLTGIGALMVSLGMGFWSNFNGFPGVLFALMALGLIVGGLLKTRIAVVVIGAFDLALFGSHWISVWWHHRLLTGLLFTLFGVLAVTVGLLFRNRLQWKRRLPSRYSPWL